MLPTISGQSAEVAIMPKSLIAAVILAPAPRVVDALTQCSPDDVRLLDAPIATALDVALDLAQAGRTPDAVLLNAELLRRGLYDGHVGELVRTALLDAGTTVAWPEQLQHYAASVLAQVFRARLAATGAAFVESAETGVESDLWTLLLREGTELRQVWERLNTVRGESK